jgi:hypothetical protein
MAAKKIKQKASTKVGGGDYFDGNYYYIGGSSSDNWNPFEGGVAGGAFLRKRDNGQPISRAEYERIMKERSEREKLAAEYEKDIQSFIPRDSRGRPVYETDDEGNSIIPPLTKEQADYLVSKYGKDAVNVQTSEVDRRAAARGVQPTTTYTAKTKDAYLGAEPVKRTSNYMSQLAVPEYELEGAIDMSPQRIASRREGYSDRTTRKIGLLGPKANRAVTDMNQAKQDHLRMVEETNRLIGKPEPGAYKGFTSNSVNQALAYAMDKAADGKKSAKKHGDNAVNAAKSVKATAEARGAALQKQFDAAGGQAKQASRLQQIIGHLAKRDQTNASNFATTQATHGLINSGPSMMASQSPFESNSIAATLRPQGA